MAIAKLRKANLGAIVGRGTLPAARTWNFQEFHAAFGRELHKSKNEVWHEAFFQHKIGSVSMRPFILLSLMVFKLCIFSNIFRRLQIVVKIIAIVLMVLTIKAITEEYNKRPTITTLESDTYPAQKVDFPGIAICSTNRMSLRAVNELAEDIYSRETTKIYNVSFKKLKSMLKYLGHLYVFDVDESEIEEVQLLHAILTRAYGDYNIDQFMKQLTPQCRSILKHCSWEGKDRVCDNMFFLRATQDGYCCTFNYARINDKFGSSKRSGFVSPTVEKSQLIDPAYGLTVILDPRADDHFYKSSPSDGLKVLIFQSQDYPDAPSGSLNEIYIPPKSEVFVSMDAISFHTTSDVLQHGVDIRNCLFSTEDDARFRGRYSYSDCIMYCRIHEILRQCKCIPFFYPKLDGTDSPRTCNLDDLLCLKKFISKWRQTMPSYLAKKDNLDEKITNEHLVCECFPSCDDITYKISSSVIPFTTKKILWDRSIMLNLNYSMLHVYFDGPNTIKLRQDVLYYWYELMSNYGGICSLFLGISIINLLEIVYVCVNLILHRIDRPSPPTAADNVEQPMQHADPSLPTTTTVKSPDVRLVKNSELKLNAVKVIDISETQIVRMQPLYWQEIPKPGGKTTF